MSDSLNVLLRCRPINSTNAAVAGSSGDDRRELRVDDHEQAEDIMNDQHAEAADGGGMDLDLLESNECCRDYSVGQWTQVQPIARPMVELACQEYWDGPGGPAPKVDHG